MRICGFAAEGLRGDRLILGTFPSKELQDYWSTRPKYEDEAGPSSAGGSGSKDEKGQSWEEWEKLMQNKENGDEPPPPPYSLEAEELQNQPASSGPPPVPLGRRPSTQSQAPSAPLSTRPAPPTVISGSRPQSLAGSSTGPRTASHPNSPLPSPLHVPTDEFNHLGISPSLPSSPRPGQGYNGLHSHSPSPRPISPAHSHHSHHSHTSSHSASAPLPPTEPGFAFPSPSVAPTPGPSGPPGPWSQAQWPPPEWSRPQGPTAVIEQFFHRDEQPHNIQTATHQHRPGYAPSYVSNQQSGSTSPPPPPLRPRPSVSHQSRPPVSPSRVDYGHGSHENVGGFAFPEAHVPATNSNFYGGSSSPVTFPSSPHDASAPQESTYYSGLGEPNSFPHAASPAPLPPPRKCTFSYICFVPCCLLARARRADLMGSL